MLRKEQEPFLRLSIRSSLYAASCVPFVVICVCVLLALLLLLRVSL